MQDSLYVRYAANDLVRNKGVNTALVVVLALSAFLMATGAMVTERLVGSVDQLFEQARPPHFLQMHTGGYDPGALARFAAEHPEVEAWHVQEMLGFDGAAIAWHRPGTKASGDFADSLVDNLVVTQNQEFDLLVDGSGAAPRPVRGEVYAPVAYQERFGLQVGDELTVRTGTGAHRLRVAGFVRDSQMASSLSSATRFLVSPTDFQELEHAGGGAAEVIVAYRLADPSSTAGLQHAYESDDTLPTNGQAVTFQMIRMVNVFSDGLVAVALVFVSLLLIAIALLNLRFVIRGTIEEQVREIGAMKAIGLPHKAITRLYLARYSAMALVACLVGGALAVVAADLLTRSARANYAEAPAGVATVLAPVLALAGVYLVVVTICRGVLARVRRVHVVSALVHGSTLDERRTARRATRRAGRSRRSALTPRRRGSLTRRLATADLRAEAGQWALVPVVFFLVTVLVTLPTNLLSTFSSPRFVTYLGAPESDLRVDLQFSGDVELVRGDVLSGMRGDDRLTDVRTFATVLYGVDGAEGHETLRVEVGDYAGGTVEFLDGARPEAGQIALSVLNADRLGVSPGDELTVYDDGDPVTVAVSGTYQDVTSGGYTAKMQGGTAAGAVAYVIYADVAEETDPAAVAAEYSEHFPTAAVVPMREYVEQTLEHVTGAFRSAAIVSFVFGTGVAVLVTTLFLRLRMSRERRRMGVMRAIGFSAGEIVAQVRGKALVAMASGTLLGLVFAATTGEALVGSAISLAGLGITRLAFVPDPLLVYAAVPLVLVAAGYLGAVAVTARLRRAEASTWLDR